MADAYRRAQSCMMARRRVDPLPDNQANPANSKSEIFIKKNNSIFELQSATSNIPKDDFITTNEFKKYEQYRINDRIIDEAIVSKKVVKRSFIEEYQASNPDNWIVYYKIGKYYFNKGWYKAAEIEFKKAQTKEITTLTDKKQIEAYLKKINKKSN